MSLSLYIHIPFCLSKCPYCDFTSGYRPEERLVQSYVDHLSREMEIFSGAYPDKSHVRTVYIGGGTPSLLSNASVEKIFSAVRRVFRVESMETTLEANPEDVNKEKADFWKSLGIDRVSLGWQSMEEKVLAVLGRRNSPEDNRGAFGFLRNAGMQNISVDWIAGVRGENTAVTMDALKELLPEHISAYQLSVEDKTLLRRRVATKEYGPLSDDESVKSYWQIAEGLEKLGWARYEISNYARKPEFFSRHNMNYWDLGETIGIGMGASGFIRGGKNIFGRRWTNAVVFKDYFSAIDRGELPAAYQEPIDSGTAMREFVMLGLRKTSGIIFHDFYRNFGKDFKQVFDMDRLKNRKDFIKEDGAGVRLTGEGVNVANSVIRSIWDVMNA